MSTEQNVNNTPFDNVKDPKDFEEYKQNVDKLINMMVISDATGNLAEYVEDIRKVYKCHMVSMWPGSKQISKFGFSPYMCGSYPIEPIKPITAEEAVKRSEWTVQEVLDDVYGTIEIALNRKDRSVHLSNTFWVEGWKHQPKVTQEVVSRLHKDGYELLNSDPLSNQYPPCKIIRW